jgi:micrococcal nuclease
MATKVIVGGVITAIAIGSVVAVAQTSAGDGRDEATVVRVIDGDTIDAEVGGRTERIRLLNVDTPETKHPQEPVQCLGPEATEYLESLLTPGDRIELEYDVERTDRYDRTLAGVFKDDALVNADIAEAGLGVAVLYEPNERFYDEVLEAQQRAEEAGEGLHDPAIDCTLPGRAQDALPPLEDLPAAIPADAAAVATALAAAGPVIAAGQALEGALDLAGSGAHVVLQAAYASTAPSIRGRLDTALPAAVEYRDGLRAKQESIKAAERRAEAESKRKAEAERQAAAERKAEEARKAAEARQTAAAREAARQAETEHEAARQWAAQQSEEARQAEAARQEAQRREPSRQAEQQGQQRQAPTLPAAPGGGPAVGGSGGQCPASHPIKGNDNSMIYHVPGQRHYGQTNSRNCFASEAAAIAAGYRKSKV